MGRDLGIPREKAPPAENWARPVAARSGVDRHGSTLFTLSSDLNGIGSGWLLILEL